MLDFLRELFLGNRFSQGARIPKGFRLKPRVASSELPWEIGHGALTTQRGCGGPLCCPPHACATTLWGEWRLLKPWERRHPCRRVGCDPRKFAGRDAGAPGSRPYVSAIPPLGLAIQIPVLPRVARCSQPWLLGRKPCGFEEMSFPRKSNILQLITAVSEVTESRRRMCCDRAIS